MIKKARYNLYLVLSILLLVGLSTIVELCLSRYHNYIYPEKADLASKEIEPGWDKSLSIRVIKIFIPDWQKEILDQERIIRISPQEPNKVINAYLKIAEIYEKVKKHEQAKEACHKILENYPADPLRKKAYLSLASIYEKENNFVRAREMNELIIQEFPDDSEAVKVELSNIAIYEKEGKYKEAIDGYKKFLDKYPRTKERDSLAFRIGLLYRKLGQTDKADEFYQGITWDKDTVWGDNARGELWLATGKGESKKKVIYALKVPVPPKIDGYLNEPVWEKGEKITDFVDYQKNNTVTQKTTASVIYDENNLYIAFNCLESNISGLAAKCTEHDKNVWSDDCIEVFMDTKRDYTNYFQLIVNPRGTTYDGDKLDLSWEPKWQAATAIGENHWNVEMAIGFKELGAPAPKAGDVWGLNLTRARRAGETEISNWSFTEGNHHRPEKFGYLIFK